MTKIIVTNTNCGSIYQAVVGRNRLDVFTTAQAEMAKIQASGFGVEWNQALHMDGRNHVTTLRVRPAHAG